jgi:hypothetical protein
VNVTIIRIISHGVNVDRHQYGGKKLNVKQTKDDFADLNYHFHRYDQNRMLEMLLYGCNIREPDHDNPFYKNIHDLTLISEYYRAMVNYGISFFLTDPDITLDREIFEFIQRWVYDQL